MSDITWQTPEPTNYTGLMIQPDPIGAFQKAAALQNTQAQTGLLNAQAQDVQQSALLNSLAVQRQQNFQQQWEQFSANPTPQGAVQMAMSNPEWATNVQNAWNGFNEQQRQQRLDMTAPVAASLQNGRPDLAANLVQQHIDAILNTPNYQSDPGLQRDLLGSQQMLATIQKSPQAALGQLWATMAAAQGPQDFMQHFGQGATMPATIATAQAAPAQAWANVGLTQSQSQDLQSGIQNRSAQFGLDQNRFLADVQLRLRNLNYTQNAPNMTPATQDIVTQGAVNSVQYGMQAQRIGTLLGNVAALDQNGQWVAGKPADVRAYWQNLWGTQDNLNTVRTEYQSLMKTLSGYGQAGISDKDFKALQGGLPAKNADPQQIVSFLGSMRNAELRAARIGDSSSSWGATFGWMGPAKYDANVGGIPVAKGTSFAQFMQRQLDSGQAAAPSAFPAPTAAPGVQISGPGAAPTQNSTPVPGTQVGAFSGGLSYLNKYSGK